VGVGPAGEVGPKVDTHVSLPASINLTSHEDKAPASTLPLLSREHSTTQSL